MVFVDYGCRTGNNLFQFAFGSLIAHLSGSELVAPEIKGFPNTKGFIKTREINSDYYRKGYDYYHLTPEQFNDIVENAKTKDVSFLCHPQNVNYYIEHKEYLKDVMKIEDGDYYKTSDNDIVVHLRLGDYFHYRFNGNWEYNMESVYDLIKTLDYDNIIIVTDEPKSIKLNIFKELPNCIISNGDMFYDYRTINNAKRIIMTHSTFSWWAAWTSDANEIYFPIHNCWENILKVDLMFKEERVIPYVLRK
jgi:hypothetical protein